MPFNLDYGNKIVEITSPTVDVSLQELHDFIEDEMASPVGLTYPDDDFGADPSTEFDGIINPQGKIDTNPSSPGVNFSQIIIILKPDWQVQFWAGSGYTNLTGGTLTGGVGNNPVKPTATATDFTNFKSPLDGTVIVGGDSAVNNATEVWKYPLASITEGIGLFVKKKLLPFGKWFGLK